MELAAISKLLKKVERQVTRTEKRYERLLTLVDPEDVRALEELDRITPSNAALLQLAKVNPPPQEWFNGEEERPW